MVEKRVEGERGCGFRKPGGLYLVTGERGAQCLKIPYPLTVCPTCSQGINPSRGFTWVNASELTLEAVVATCGLRHCIQCPLGGGPAKTGLIWVGEAYYKTPKVFLEEALRMGISRRITAIPRGFEVGVTWVLLAHRKAFPVGREDSPGIFQAFRPTAIEYVVKGGETEEELKSLRDRGITPVEVVYAVTGEDRTS